MVSTPLAIIASVLVGISLAAPFPQQPQPSEPADIYIYRADPPLVASGGISPASGFFVSAMVMEAGDRCPALLAPIYNGSAVSSGVQLVGNEQDPSKVRFQTSGIPLHTIEKKGSAYVLRNDWIDREVGSCARVVFSDPHSDLNNISCLEPWTDYTYQAVPLFTCRLSI